MVGIWEFLVVVVCVIIFIKPDDLPKFLKFVRDLYSYFLQIKNSLIKSIENNPTELNRLDCDDEFLKNINQLDNDINKDFIMKSALDNSAESTSLENNDEFLESKEDFKKNMQN